MTDRGVVAGRTHALRAETYPRGRYSAGLGYSIGGGSGTGPRKWSSVYGAGRAYTDKTYNGRAYKDQTYSAPSLLLSRVPLHPR